MGIVACKIDGCVKASFIKKWRLCKTHYRAQRAAGVLEVRSSAQRSLMRQWACELCSGQFESRYKRRFCLKSCENKWYRNHGDKPCTVVGCDRPLVATGLCHAHYKRKARAEGRESLPVWDERRKAHWYKRDALKRGSADSVLIVNAEVFERDGWMCGICGERIDPAVVHPDPLSVSLDHIIPLVKGGAHVLANVQAAHLICNLSKGDR